MGEVCKYRRILWQNNRITFTANMALTLRYIIGCGNGYGCFCQIGCQKKRADDSLFLAMLARNIRQHFFVPPRALIDHALNHTQWYQQRQG